MKDKRFLKRYQNSKIYDTFQACYVTLEEIAQIIREGNEIVVMNNRDQEDITYKVYLEVIINQERKNKKEDNLNLLKKIIRSDTSSFLGYIESMENKNN